MSEFGRILTNLGLAYGLMSKDEFVDRVARYASEKNMSEEKMMALVENLFEELEITHKRMQAKQMFEAVKMKKYAEGGDKDFFHDAPYQEEQSKKDSGPQPEIMSELKSLRVAIENLTNALKNKPEGE